ncbi:MAG: cation-translocating P-type ATPase [Pseudomonadota bacterium]
MHPDSLPPAFQLTAAEVLTRLGTDPERGLDGGEVQRRRTVYGPNALAARKPVPRWRKFLAQFGDVLVVLLLVAAAISTALWWVERESALPYESLAILAVVLLNAVMGYVQQARAERAVAALRDMSAARAHVLREGTRQDIPAADLVPGDIILLEEGDTVPADGRLLQAVALQAAEAALTGESLPVAKDVAPVSGEPALGDQHNMVFSGTAITSGRGRAVVTATGMGTQMGRIAGLLHETPGETTPLHREIAHVGKLLGAAVVAIAVVMIATILLVQDIQGLAAFFDVLILGVALAVAAVPEGLPAVVTAVLALGVQRMARRHAIVRHLSAVETLGSATVIASDKTGTLTRNEMTVRTLVTASGSIHFGGTGYAPEGEVRSEGGPLEGALREEFLRAMAAGDRANNAVLQERDGRWIVQGDPTEAALIVAARKAGFTDEMLDARFTRVAEVPFSSERKLMSTVHRDARRDEVLVAFTKGAPDVLLTRCTHEQVGAERRPLTSQRRAEIQKTNEALACKGLRTLGLALRLLPRDAIQHDPAVDGHLEEDLVFLGLVGMIDPPRAEAAEAVARARQAGIRPLMITGDHPVTARVIAAELGIAQDGRVATGAELEKASDEELAAIVRDTSVYARVDPTHKLRIVRALQSQGQIVAMTGDGVNDAPALKSAEIGVAMGITGTDVSKEAADIVLADDNFATIVAAVEEGRAILSNIRKFLRYLLSSNIGEVMTMFLGVLLAGVIGLPAGDGGVVLPLLATQILWINLVTDGAPALALGVDPSEPGVMERPPRARGERIITRPMWRGIFLVGVIMAAGTLFVLDASLPGGLFEGTHDVHHAQTMAFLTLVLFNVFNVFNARSDEQSMFNGLFRNAWLWGAVLLALVLQVAVIHVPFLQAAFSTTPLGFSDWLLCTAVASSVLWLRELDKLIVRRRRHAGQARRQAVR